MNKLLLTTAVFAALSGTAFAQEAKAPLNAMKPFASLNGNVETVIKEGATGNWGATTSFDLGVQVQGSSTARMDFVLDQNGVATLDEWAVGTEVAGVSLSFGDQGGVFVEAESDYASIIDPAINENLQVAVGDAKVALGWTDVTADVTEIENIQGAYTLNMGFAKVTASGDYNMNSEEWAIGSRAVVDGLVDRVAIGATTSYGSVNEKMAYELDATAFNVTAYLNGDQDTLAQNVGGVYGYKFNGLLAEAGVNYNLDTEKTTPQVTLSFEF